MVGACKGWFADAGASIEFSGLPTVAGSSEAMDCTSSLTSRSQVRLKSSEARRNSAMLFPSERLNCGSLRGPKKTRAITKMNSSSVLPSDSRISKTTFRKFLSVTSSNAALCSLIVTRRLTKQKHGARRSILPAFWRRLALQQTARLTPSRRLAQPWFW